MSKLRLSIKCSLRFDRYADNQEGSAGTWRAKALVNSPWEQRVEAESQGTGDASTALLRLEKRLRDALNLPPEIGIEFDLASITWPDSRGGVEPGGGSSDG